MDLELKDKHILVVEDEAITSLAVAKSLEKRGLKVTTAASGEEGIKLAKELHPDLVLMDIMLPGIDGKEAAHEIRETLNIPVVYLTALTNKTVSPVIIGKPYSEEELYSVVANSLKLNEKHMWSLPSSI